MSKVILLYHDVLFSKVPQSGFQSPAALRYTLSEESFIKHLRCIKAVNPEAVLTFDDGGISALMTADLLEASGMRGHFFIPTAFIGSQHFLSRPDIQSLQSRGHTIGSHSHSHPQKMSALSSAQISKEWIESVLILEDITGSDIRTASVPGGFYSKKVALAAAEANITTLFTSEPTYTAWLEGSVETHGRFSIMSATRDESLSRLLRGSVVEAQLRTCAWGMKKAAKTMLGSTWFRLREGLLDSNE